MPEKRPTPLWWKRLLELGNPSHRQSDSKGRAYRTVTYRYFWGLTSVFVYFLLASYLLGGDGAGSSDNSGIYKLILGALLFGFLGAFFAPRLNEALERLLPSGRRKQEEKLRKQSRTSSSRSSRRSGSSDRSSSKTRSGVNHSQASSADQTHSSSDKTGL